MTVELAWSSRMRMAIEVVGSVTAVEAAHLDRFVLRIGETHELLTDSLTLTTRH